MNYSEQLKFLKVGEEVIIEPSGEENTVRKNIYGALAKKLGMKFKVHKIYKVKRVK